MLGIVIVIYKSFEQTLAFVQNELPKISLPWRAVIVDVGSAVDHSKKLAETLGIALVTDFEESVADSPVIILHCFENLGYARGNNLGVKFLLNRHPTIDKLLFTNDDIELIDTNAADLLAQRLDEQPDVAAVGPAVINLQDVPQPPFFNEPHLWYNVRRNIGIPFWGNAAYATAWNPHGPSQLVYSVGGCFFMARADDFIKAEMFDDRTFLYWEELILGARFKAIGKKVLYEPEVHIRHFVGNTTRNLGTDGLLLLLRNELAGQRLFFRDYAHAGTVSLLFLKLSALIRTALVRLALFRRRIFLRSWSF